MDKFNVARTAPERCSSAGHCETDLHPTPGRRASERSSEGHVVIVLPEVLAWPAVTVDEGALRASCLVEKHSNDVHRRTLASSHERRFSGRCSLSPGRDEPFVPGPTSGDARVRRLSIHGLLIE